MGRKFPNLTCCQKPFQGISSGEVEIDLAQVDHGTREIRNSQTNNIHAQYLPLRPGIFNLATHLNLEWPLTTRRGWRGNFRRRQGTAFYPELQRAPCRIVVETEGVLTLVVEATPEASAAKAVFPRA
jgi:hypothetical protein